MGLAKSFDQVSEPTERSEHENDPYEVASTIDEPLPYPVVFAKGRGDGKYRCVGYPEQGHNNLVKNIGIQSRSLLHDNDFGRYAFETLCGERALAGHRT